MYVLWNVAITNIMGFTFVTAEVYYLHEVCHSSPRTMDSIDQGLKMHKVSIETMHPG